MTRPFAAPTLRSFAYTKGRLETLIHCVGTMVQIKRWYPYLEPGLSLLMEAASATSQYLTEVRDNPAASSHDRQAALAALWDRAGKEMYQFDRGLGRHYLIEVDYWSDPEDWTPEEKEKRIALLNELLSVEQSITRMRQMVSDATPH